LDERVGRAALRAESVWRKHSTTMRRGLACLRDYTVRCATLTKSFKQCKPSATLHESLSGSKAAPKRLICERRPRGHSPMTLGCAFATGRRPPRQGTSIRLRTPALKRWTRNFPHSRTTLSWRSRSSASILSFLAIKLEQNRRGHGPRPPTRQHRAAQTRPVMRYAWNLSSWSLGNDLVVKVNA
jgi:hypothetical protein